MTLTSYLPQELWIYKIIPSLPEAAMNVFCFLSKEARTLLFSALNTTYRDRTLANKEVSYIPGSIPKFSRFIQKSLVIERSPALFEQLAQARIKTTAAGKNPDEINSILRFGSKGTGCLAASVVVFDYESQQMSANGPYGLGAALSEAIRADDQELVDAVFLHSNIKNMKLEDFGITLCLGTAFKKGNIDVVKKILSFPLTQGLKADGETDSIGHFLKLAVSTNDIKLVTVILSLANAKQISGVFIGEALVKAVENDNLEVVATLMSLPNATKIPQVLVDYACVKAKGDNKKAIIAAITA